MNSKYTKYYDISLEEMKDMISHYLKVNLYRHSIYTLGDFFNFTEQNERHMLRKLELEDSKLKEEFLGTIKLLRYQYLKEDPKWNEYDFLKEFGFSRRAENTITLSGLYNIYLQEDEKNINIHHLMNTILSEEGDSILKETKTVGPVVYKEIQLKAKIILNYFEEKEKNQEETKEEDAYINFLVSVLNNLMIQNEQLNKEIERIRNEINQYRRNDSNGRKK